MYRVALDGRSAISDHFITYGFKRKKNVYYQAFYGLSMEIITRHATAVRIQALVASFMKHLPPTCLLQQAGRLVF